MEVNKGGRPRKEVDFSEFEKLCQLQCTREEVCAWFDMDENTLDARLIEQYGQGFSLVYKQKRGAGKISLRRKQMQVALAGNPTMLIFLGKNYLEQSDKVEQKHIEDKPSEVKIIFQQVASDIDQESFYDKKDSSGVPQS